MFRNTRTKRTASIGVERLDDRISLSAVHFAAAPVTTYVPTPAPTFKLPPTPMPPTVPGTFVNITGLHLFGLSK